MSTVQEQLANHSYPTTSVPLVDMYLYILFIYIAGAALISGIGILIIYRLSKHEKIKMVKK